MPDSQYNVNILIKSTDQSSAPTKKATSAMDGLKKAAAAAAIAYGMLRTAQKAVDFVKGGAEIQRQANALDNLAFAAGTSANAIIGSIREASGYTIDSMTAMQVANRALVMNVAQTPAEFAKLTETAVTLGRAMGMDAVQSIDKFVMAIGRQSRLVADDFGLIISTEEAYRKYAESIGVATDALTGEQQRLAFGMEMMTQATDKVTTLGGVTKDAAADFESISASIKETKDQLALMSAELLESTGALEFLAERAALLPNTLNAVWIEYIAWGAAVKELTLGINNGTTALDAYRAQVLRMILNSNSGKDSIEILHYAYTAFSAAVDGANQAMAAASGVSAHLSESMRNMVGPVDAAAVALRELSETQRKQEAAIAEQNRLLWDAQQAQADYADRAREAAQVAEDEAAVAAEILASEMERLWAETSNATIASQDLAAQLMDASGPQVATIMINMLSESLLAGSLSQEAYRASVESLQLQFGLATPETIKLAKAMAMLNTALEGGEIDPDQLGMELANLDALKAQQAQVVANANATRAAASVKRDATQASREHEAALREEQRALEAQERATRRSAEAYWDLTQSLKDADVAKAASAIKDKLNAALEAGTISVEKYDRAMKQLLLGTGMATPESMALVTGLETLVDAFTGGDLLSRELLAAITALVGQTTNGGGGGTTNYNIFDPTGAAVMAEQARRDARAAYAGSAGGG